MPYSRSRARDGFEAEVNKLLRLAKRVSFKSSPLSYEHRQLVNQSCVFLLSARMEDFTKNLIEDLLYNYKNKGAVLSHLPKNVRTKALLDNQVNYYRNFYSGSDERTLLKSISIDNRVYEIINDSQGFAAQISPFNIIGANKYPSVKNLRILYFRIGIDDIVKDLNQKAKKDIKTNIASFLSLRESIAHQGSPAITYSDVERHFDNMSEVINYIDRIVYSHIRKESGEEYWK